MAGAAAGTADDRHKAQAREALVDRRDGVAKEVCDGDGLRHVVASGSLLLAGFRGVDTYQNDWPDTLLLLDPGEEGGEEDDASAGSDEDDEPLVSELAGELVSVDHTTLVSSEEWDVSEEESSSRWESHSISSS